MKSLYCLAVHMKSIILWFYILYWKLLLIHKLKIISSQLFGQTGFPPFLKVSV